MNRKSIYKYAAELGIPVGLYLTAMSACMLLSMKFPFLPVLIVPLAIGFPVLLWAVMRKIGREEANYMKFSSLWLGGIYTVIFGTLICMLFSSLYIVFVEPSFVSHYVSHTISTIESSPMAADYKAATTLMKSALEARILPSGMEFLTSIAWFTCFSGSILSLIWALLIPKFSRKVSRVTE